MNDVDNSSPSDALIIANQISKKFAKHLGRTLIYGLSDIGSEFLSPRNRMGKKLREAEFLAVDNASFSLSRGESLGIIGHNGSGKSTLLKMICGLIKPDSGEIRIRGRVAALVELGAGFDPILSGRENVYVNASILGMERQEVDDIMEQIVSFSGLVDFMETPVKFYSSGMKSRLAYSVAINLKPDVFVVDEVLAVGDSDFQHQCIRSMMKYVDQGGSLLFVSHAGNQVQTVCRRGIVMEKGRILYDGTSDKAMDCYYSLSDHATKQSSSSPNSSYTSDNPQEPSGKEITIKSLQIRSAEGLPVIRSGQGATIQAICDCARSLEAVAHFSIWNRDGWTCITGGALLPSAQLTPGRHLFSCHLDRLPLVPGLYQLKFIFRDPSNVITLAEVGWDGSPVFFSVEGDDDLITTISKMINQVAFLDFKWESPKLINNSPNK